MEPGKLAANIVVPARDGIAEGKRAVVEPDIQPENETALAAGEGQLVICIVDSRVFTERPGKPAGVVNRFGYLRHRDCPSPTAGESQAKR